MDERADERVVRRVLGRRRADSAALTAMLAVLVVVPVWLLAMAAIWLLVHLVWDVSFLWFALGYLALGIVLFWRPAQVVVVARLVGARRPDRRERAVLETAWRSVLQANHLPRHRYALAVLPADDLNAFACGGHLVVVTSYAIDALPRDELVAVLAHELSHHLGLHTVALTIGQWLTAPVLVLARVGFFLQSVATAATESFARRSSSLTAVGTLISSLLTAVSWLFLSGLVFGTLLANSVGHSSEFQADRRVVAMGFGRPLASALRRVIGERGSDRPRTWRERLAATHPPARTRVARIEALLRARR